MARKPIVLEPPTPPRKPVVLREGPGDRSIGTPIAAAIGILLLIVSVAMFSVLPEEEAPLPQYEVSFTEEISSQDGSTLSLTEGNVQEFPIDFTGDSLFGMAIHLAWMDDRAASHPDEYEVTLETPNGTTVLGPKVLRNRQPIAGDNPGSFEAYAESTVLSFAVAPRPSTEILTAPSHEATLADMQVLAAKFEGAPAGIWTLKVNLVQAGDCPAPQSLDTLRTAACFSEDPSGLDDSNDMEIVRVDFTQYHATVQPLGES